MTNLTKNSYNFDSLTPDSYCCIGCCHFYFIPSTLLPLFVVVVQVQLSPFPPPHHSLHPSHPHVPPSILPSLGFVLVSFTHVPDNPSPFQPQCPLPPPFWSLSVCSLFQVSGYILFVWLIRFHLQVRSYGVVIFLFDNLREKRSVPLSKQSGIICFKNSCSTPVCHGTLLENHCWRKLHLLQHLP